MLTRLRAWYAQRSNAVKAGVATAATTFAALFVPALFGWANDVLSWVADWGGNSAPATPFPDPSVLTKAAVAAITAAAVGLLNTAWRAIQARTSAIPGTGPDYPSDVG